MSSPLKTLETALTETSWCAGTCSVGPENFHLYYRSGLDASYINLANASTDQLNHLANTCGPASFGRGGEDVHDPSYRKAGKLDLEQFASTFDLVGSGILKTVGGELTDDKEEFVRAELYKLNVYSDGGFFKTHQDTPRAENMFGSLVIVFPTPYEGGSLVLRKDDDELICDYSEELSSSMNPSVGYAAFFSDTDHEVLPVTSGHRITLTYNLYMMDESLLKGTPAESVEPMANNRLHDAVVELLKEPKYDLSKDDNLRLFFGLKHQYPLPTSSRFDLRDYNFPRLLKGSDSLLYQAFHDLGYTPYFRILYETENYVKSYWLTPVPWHGAKYSQLEGNELEASLKEIGEFVGYKGGAAPKKKDYSAHKIDGKIVWVTGLRGEKNKVKHDYVAYGNEATVACFYGWIVMVVESPDSDSSMEE